MKNLFLLLFSLFVLSSVSYGKIGLYITAKSLTTPAQTEGIATEAGLPPGKNFIMMYGGGVAFGYDFSATEIPFFNLRTEIEWNARYGGLGKETTTIFNETILSENGLLANQLLFNMLYDVKIGDVFAIHPMGTVGVGFFDGSRTMETDDLIIRSVKKQIIYDGLWGVGAGMSLAIVGELLKLDLTYRFMRTFKGTFQAHDIILGLRFTI